MLNPGNDYSSICYAGQKTPQKENGRKMYGLMNKKVIVSDNNAHSFEYKHNSVLNEKKFGTVGAVALDQSGNLAAATSTGGMTNKKYGRIGDSPLIGSGTYASNESCAVSCTGSGEYFILTNAAFHVSALMQYGGKNLSEATGELIHQILPKIGGDGGLIGIDRNGNISMVFNTEGMYRASWNEDGEIQLRIYS